MRKRKKKRKLIARIMSTLLCFSLAIQNLPLNTWAAESARGKSEKLQTEVLQTEQTVESEKDVREEQLEEKIEEIVSEKIEEEEVLETASSMEITEQMKTSVGESINESDDAMESMFQAETTSEAFEEESTENIEVIADAADITMQGNGTDESPYIITNVSQLKQVKENLSASYILANDLYLGTDAWEPIGDADNPFTGHFSGDNHVIYGVNGFQSGIKYRGLFGMASEESIIERLGVEMDEGVEYRITTNDNEFALTGLLTGNAKGTIKYCYAKGRLIGEKQSLRGDGGGPYTTGVLCGKASGNIFMCYSEGEAMSSYTGYMISSGCAYTGGICGNGGKAVITNCYSICDLSGYANGYATTYNYCGGIVGYGDDKTKVNKCYAISNMSGDSLVRTSGITNYGTTDNCYYIKRYKIPNATSPVTYREGTETNVKNEQAMKLASTYKGWDFKNTWVMGSDGYPKLQYFQKTSTADNLSLVVTNPVNNEDLVPVDTDISLYFMRIEIKFMYMMKMVMRCHIY